MTFAVIDFETTGLVPEKHDRVVEVAVVLLDEDGQVEWEWTSLINPKRDIGATRIHGIHAADVLDAPEFGDIADSLLDTLRGRTVVAHNASFDMRFLHCELQRSGYGLPRRPDALCSMKWAGRLIGPAKLSHCCEALGIEHPNAHSALSDARATSELVTWLSRVAVDDPEWPQDVSRSASFAWPSAFASGKEPRSVSRSDRGTRPEHSWLDTIMGNTWVPGTNEAEASYLVTLDSALLDLSISATEGQQLVAAAQACGLSPARAHQLHLDHLDFLAREAWSDGILTEREHAELTQVAAALRLSPEALQCALRDAESAQRSGEHRGDEASFLRPGDRIVFTGEMRHPRDVWVQRIVAAGLASGGVTKSTRVLVTSDPDSMSGKAAKARGYGVPVIDEAAFERMFEDYRGLHERS